MLRSFMRLLVPVASALTATLLAMPACATETTFASFSNAPNGSFVATNTDTANGSLTLTDSSTVTFGFLVTALATDIGNVTANYVLTASSANTNLNTADAAQGLVYQPLFNGSMTFTSTQAIKIGSTTYAAGSNLLTATFTDGRLLGNIGFPDVGLSADSSHGTVTYTSDFLNFSDTISRDYSISTSAVIPPLTVHDSPSYLDGFTSTPTGSFATDPVPFITADVPEPATWAMMLVGLGAVGLSLRGTSRRRELRA